MEIFGCASPGARWSNVAGELGAAHDAPAGVWQRVDVGPLFSSLARPFRAIACIGMAHSAAVCADGHVWLWGGGEPVRAVATGGESVVALHAVPLATHCLCLAESGRVALVDADATAPLACRWLALPHALEAAALQLAADGSGAVAALWGVPRGTARAQLWRYALCPGDAPSAVCVHAGAPVRALAASGLTTLALCDDGALLGGGWDGAAQLGLGAAHPEAAGDRLRAIGTASAAPPRLRSCAAGPWHSAATCEAGGAYVWGRGKAGAAAGHGDVPSLLPQALGAAWEARIVALGCAHVCLALADADGALVFALGADGGEHAPAALPGHRVSAVACGAHHALALCCD